MSDDRARLDAEARAIEAEKRLAEARQVVLELQRDLLPPAVPVLPRVRLAAHYLVAAAELSAGGDWFDAIPLAGGRIALVVGDVVGHGAVAAAAMAQLRTVLREALLSGVPLAEAVDRLDRYAATGAAMRAATVCAATLDPETGTLTWISRAHPPLLLCAPDGRVRFLDTGRAAPLGVDKPSAAPASTVMTPGEVVLLYSDGLVERPGETIADGLSRLARVAGAATPGASPSDAGSSPPPRASSLDAGSSPPPGVAFAGVASPSAADLLCGVTVERITREAFSDDVTALAACLLPAAPAPLTLSVPARVSSLPSVRDSVSTWLSGQVGADRDDETALSLAVSEAAANAVAHSGSAELRVSLSFGADGVVTATVADDGRWREPGPGRSGRGLSLIHACAELDLERRPDGTTAVIRRELRHPTVAGPAGIGSSGRLS
jgi:anti-sigma regulatory factor (Ser/Thr protein kinase)